MRASGTPSRLGIFGGCSSLAEAKGRRGGASTFSVDLIARIPCSTPRFRERRQPISAGFQTTCKPGGLDWLRSPPGSSKGPHASAPPAGSKNRRPPLMQRSPSRNKTNNPTFCHSHRTISSRAIEYRPAPYVSTTRAAFRCFCCCIAIGHAGGQSTFTPIPAGRVQAFAEIFQLNLRRIHNAVPRMSLCASDGCKSREQEILTLLPRPHACRWVRLCFSCSIGTSSWAVLEAGARA